MKQTRYNYHGRPVGPQLAQTLRMEGLKATPTTRQRKFLHVLESKLNKASVQIYDEKHPKPVCREGYCETINRLIELCEQNNIQLDFLRNKNQQTDTTVQTEPDPDDPFDM